MSAARSGPAADSSDRIRLRVGWAMRAGGSAGRRTSPWRQSYANFARTIAQLIIAHYMLRI